MINLCMLLYGIIEKVKKLQTNNGIIDMRTIDKEKCRIRRNLKYFRFIYKYTKMYDSRFIKSYNKRPSL